MYDLKELGLLAAALTVREIPFRSKEIVDGWGLVGENWDAIINNMTMGATDGLIEVVLLDEWKTSVDYNAGTYGFLTASEALELLENKGLIPDLPENKGLIPQD